MSEIITGELEYISFHDEDSGYTVARFRERSSDETITAVGHLVCVQAGEFLRLTGNWKQHPRFGRQFAVESYECVYPETVEGIERYLGSGAIKGIGPKTAEKIVASFGCQTLEVIEKQPDKLNRIPGLGAKKIEVISRAWQEQREIRRVMVVLQGYGLGGALATRIYREYGNNAVEAVTRNPYQLAEQVRGIGFLTADRIAQNLGMELDSPLRLASGLLFAMEKAEDRGHTCLPLERLIERAADLLKVEPERLEPPLEEMVGLGRLVVETEGTGERFIYSARCHWAETIVTEVLGRFVARGLVYDLFGEDQSDKRWFEALNEFERECDVELSVDQTSAVVGVLRDRISVITGGPGTGKTTIIAAIIKLMSLQRVRVVLAAPTGRAAKRLSETTRMPASTIHRLLGWSFQEGRFLHHSGRPLEGDVFIVDEVSMVDLPLFANLLAALPPDASLILVGDVDQLPSIGPGKILADLIECGRLSVYRLQEVFRQARSSLIIQNAHRVRKGLMPVDSTADGEHYEQLKGGEDEQWENGEKDFFLMRLSDPEKVREAIVRLAGERLNARFGIDPMLDLQVITPMNKGPCGTRALNELLQQTLNSGAEKIPFSGRKLYRGDRVMQLRNDYEKDVFNGDVGLVLAFDQEMHTVTVDFDGRSVRYESHELDDLDVAYAVTVHKSQGSEYPAVIISLLREHYVMLQRNLLYTALSRGKRVVVLVGDPKAIGRAVKNAKEQFRHSRLADRLRAIERF
jgi:exodeoxyribonuclease V alpha subunit